MSDVFEMFQRDKKFEIFAKDLKLFSGRNPSHIILQQLQIHNICAVRISCGNLLLNHPDADAPLWIHDRATERDDNNNNKKKKKKKKKKKEEEEEEKRRRRKQQQQQAEKPKALLKETPKSGISVSTFSYEPPCAGSIRRKIDRRLVAYTHTKKKRKKKEEEKEANWCGAPPNAAKDNVVDIRVEVGAPLSRGRRQTAGLNKRWGTNQDPVEWQPHDIYGCIYARENTTSVQNLRRPCEGEDSEDDDEEEEAVPSSELPAAKTSSPFFGDLSADRGVFQALFERGIKSEVSGILSESSMNADLPLCETGVLEVVLSPPLPPGGPGVTEPNPV
ncbi:hypothetical protein WN51_03066 [Melipona quadrifasciata]|uniref:Uncharacterized protein n=1 Tax=Melipona quadrifasciata TaxID=166423 RepID=A0A0N0BEX5_9HYME|nr:hypothetical protein WN51_03066 [Melipona quadrifasciata]